METHLFSYWSYLLDDAAEKIKIDEFLRTDDLRAETALQVTDVTDFDVHFGETLGRHGAF